MDTVNIALIGPESTGKSTLAAQLAEHFDAPYIEEYARKYLEDLEDVYSVFDLEMIALGQLELISSARQSGFPLFFSDTDLVTLHIWSVDKFNQSLSAITDYLYTHKANFYLICAPDIPWVYDVLREDPERREYLFQKNLELIQDMGAAYTIVQGEGAERFNCARSAVEAFLKGG
jgi:nicotinamide riboside kinase